MAIFMDIEVVGVDAVDPPDAYAVTFDVIYAGETWCRSLVWVETAVAAQVDRDEHAVISAARDALLGLLEYEAVPVSLALRLTTAGTVVLDRGTPGNS